MAEKSQNILFNNNSDKYFQVKQSDNNVGGNNPGGSIWAFFYDTDGRVDISDVRYSSSEVADNNIEEFIRNNYNKPYDDNLLNKLNSFIQSFNKANKVRVEESYDDRQRQKTVVIHDSDTDEAIEKVVKDSEKEYYYSGSNLDTLTCIKIYWLNDDNIKEFYEISQNDTDSDCVQVKKTTYRRDGTKYSEEIREIEKDKCNEPDNISKEFKNENNNLKSKINYLKDGSSVKDSLIYNPETEEYIYEIIKADGSSKTDHYDMSMKKTSVSIKNSSIYGNFEYKINPETHEIEYCERPNIDYYNEESLNGTFDVDMMQGASGTCYIVAPCLSLKSTPSGKKILDEAVDYKKEKDIGIGTVNFQGIDKTYQFTEKEIRDAIPRLGRAEPDFVTLVLGYEAYRQENGKDVESGDMKEFLIAILPPNTKIEQLTFSKIDADKYLDTIMKDMNNEHEYVIVAGTPPETVENEWIQEERDARRYMNGHAYVVTKITKDWVFVIEPNSGKEDEYKRKEFKDKFGGMVYVKLK